MGLAGSRELRRSLREPAGHHWPKLRLPSAPMGHQVLQGCALPVPLARRPGEFIWWGIHSRL